MKDNIVKDKSFKYTVRIINLYKIMCETRKEFIISKQLLRSGTSVGANIREAVNAQSTADFIHKLSIAKKECDESLYWLELMNETGYINNVEFGSLQKDANELLKIISSIIMTSKAKNS